MVYLFLLPRLYILDPRSQRASVRRIHQHMRIIGEIRHSQESFVSQEKRSLRPFTPKPYRIRKRRYRRRMPFIDDSVSRFLTATAGDLPRMKNPPK